MRIICLLFVIATLQNTFAQDQIGINPPSLKWSKMHTPAGDIIYPRGLDSTALSIAYRINSAFLLDTSEVLLNKSSKAITTVLQNQSIFPEGYPTTIPWHQEFYLTPPQNMFLGPTVWKDALTTHEYRHAQQFVAFNKGWTYLYKTLLGNTGWLLSSIMNIPLWYREGDAVDSETRFTTGGRGTLPSFHMEYRALRLNNVLYSYDKAMSALNFKDFVPNVYRSGYFMTSLMRKQHGDKIWANVLDKATKRFARPFTRALKELTGQGIEELYETTFTELDSIWAQSDSITHEIGRRITKRSDVFEQYRMPQMTSDGSLIVSYKSFKKIRSFYQLLRDSTIEKIQNAGMYTTDHENFTIEGNLMAWAESAFHPRYSNKTYSIIKYKDFSTDKITQLSHRSRYFSPAPSKDGTMMAVIEYNALENCRLLLINLDSEQVVGEFSLHNQFITQPRWVNEAEIIVISINFEGNQLMLLNINTGQWQVLLNAFDINISNPFAYENEIFFSSGLTGIENIYMINTATRAVRQMTNARFGAFDPFVHDETLYFSNYDFNGYEIWESPLDESLHRSVDFPSSPSFSSMPDYDQDSVHLLIQSSITIDTNYNKFFWNKLLSSTGWFPLVIGPEIGAEFYFLNMERSMKATVGVSHNTNENIVQTKFNAQYAKLFPVVNGMFTIQSRKIQQPGVVYPVDSISSIIYKETVVSGGLEIPLRLTQGVYLSNLNLNIDFAYHHLNRLRESMPTFDFKTVNLGGSFSRLRPSARRQVQTSFGQVVKMQFKKGLANADPEQLFIDAQFYFPGLVSTHSLNFRGSYESNKNTDDYRHLSLFKASRGYLYYPFEDSYIISTNYELPLFYPDFYIKGFMGVTRVRFNAFFDYSSGSTIVSDQLRRSYGGELILDIRLVRAFNMDLRLQFIKIQDHFGSQRPFVFKVAVSQFELLN